MCFSRYGVVTIRRLLKIIGLFCRISSLLQGSFAKESYNFKKPTNRSHPICLQPPHSISSVAREGIFTWHDVFTWRKIFTYVASLMHIRDMTHVYVRHDPFICVTWLVHMCDMTHSYILYALLAVVYALLIAKLYLRDMALYTWHDSHMWHDQIICVTWLIHICNMPFSRWYILLFL